MFDWFKKPDYTNVVKFPEAKPVPYIEPPAKDPVTFYTIGPTDNNRIKFSIGHNSITMNKSGLQALINILQSANDQLLEDEE